MGNNVNFTEEQEQQQENPSVLVGFLCGFNCLKFDTDNALEILADVLAEELILYLCMTKIPIDANNAEHVLALKQIYKDITGNEIQIPENEEKSSFQINSELWESIGFLSNNPITEFRSMGLLGVMFLLYISAFDELLVKELFNLSKQSDYRFPLCMALLHLSKVVIDTIKSGKLNRYCNQLLYTAEVELNTDDSATRKPIIQECMFSFYSFIARQFLTVCKEKKIREDTFQIDFENHIISRISHFVRSWIKEEKRKKRKSALSEKLRNDTQSVSETQDN